MHGVFADLAVFQFRDVGAFADRDFIHAIRAVHHQHMAAAEPLQHARLDADQVRMEHAQHLVFRAGGIGQRPQHVEHRAHAEFAAHRRGVFHRAVEIGREHEADADLVYALADLFRGQVEVDAERFQHIRRAAGRRHRAPAVLGDPRTRRGGDQRAGGGDIEGVRGIAAGAAGIHQMGAVG